MVGTSLVPNVRQSGAGLNYDSKESSNLSRVLLSERHSCTRAARASISMQACVARMCKHPLPGCSWDDVHGAGEVIPLYIRLIMEGHLLV